MDVKRRGSRKGAGKYKAGITVTAVRRSTRKCEKVIERERLENWKDKVRRKQDVDGLKVKEIESKGRGVFSTQRISTGTYICEYSGVLRSKREAFKFEKDYEKDEKIGCYMYYFTFRGENYCVDATKEDGTIGRLINHSRINPNVKSLSVEVDGTPHVIFKAIRDIKPGEELCYDYGDRAVTSLKSHPWLKL